MEHLPEEGREARVPSQEIEGLFFFSIELFAVGKIDELLTVLLFQASEGKL